MASFLLNQQPNIRSSTCAVFTLVLDMLGQLVLSPWTSAQQMLNYLHHCLTCCSLITSSPHICISWQWIQMGEPSCNNKTIWHYKFIHRTNCPMSLPSQINMTGSCAIYCMYVLQVLPPTTIYRLGNVKFIWLFLSLYIGNVTHCTCLVLYETSR
jgi:hypothetical protein